MVDRCGGGDTEKEEAAECQPIVDDGYVLDTDLYDNLEEQEMDATLARIFLEDMGGQEEPEDKEDEEVSHNIC